MGRFFSCALAACIGSVFLAANATNTTTYVFILDQQSTPSTPETSISYEWMTSIRSDGKYVKPHFPHIKPTIEFENVSTTLVPIQTDNLMMFHDIIQAWVHRTCPNPANCITFGWKVEQLEQLPSLPCYFYTNEACPRQSCALFGTIGCRERSLCDIFKSPKTCPLTGFCKWNEEKCSIKH